MIIQYVVQKGPDGTTWLSMEPFMENTKNAIITLMDMNLPLEEEQNRNDRVTGLKTVYELMGSIIQDAKVNK
jgi:hypothetical protein